VARTGTVVDVSDNNKFARNEASMNHERAELIDAMRATARSMRECSGKIHGI